MAIQVSPGINVSEIDLTTVIPAVSTTAGAFAGIFSWGPVNQINLVTSEADVVSKFGKPTSSNYETFYTAANFLAYGNALNLVRVIDGAYNAYASINATATANLQVLNTDSYNNTSVSSNALYVAKYPGTLGNSLKVSVCDNPNAYSQNVSLSVVQTTYTNVTSFSLTSNTGSNVALLILQANAAGTANTAAQNISTWLTIGDLVSLGNTVTGTQVNKISALTASGTETSNSGTYTTTVTINLASPVYLAGNVTQNTVLSQWEYFNQVDAAPTTSAYLQSKGYTAVDEVHVVVTDAGGLITGVPGTVLEVFPHLSRATDAKSVLNTSIYYKTILNNNSNYVWFGNDRAGAASANSSTVANSTNQSPFTQTFTGGLDGNGEANCSLTAITSGYDFFKSKVTSDISLVLAGKARGVAAETTSPSSNTQNYSTIANYIISNIVNVRKDCVAFISPALPDAVVQTTAGDAVANMLAFLNNLSTASTYAVMDSGYKYQYDKYNDVLRWVPLNGDVAGTCVYTDTNRQPWFSPAGFSRGQIKNVSRLALNPNQAQRDNLYKASINPVTTFPGQGTVLFGDKTLAATPSAFDRINVRRLFITLEKAISRAAQSSLFEFNDSFTRAQFVGLVTPYLRDIQGGRGITDFKVICDETNNPPSVVDGNQFVGDIYIKPARSINYIQLNFVAVASGVDFNTIIGQF
jgi:hypothetical protein